MLQQIGFMQGRLSPIVDNKIQAFPWEYWKEEFQIANNCGFSIIEWTLDQSRLYENPLMSKAGQKEINILVQKYQVSIPSITGDCFMQAPFFKVKNKNRDILLKDLINIITACGLFGIENIVFPLVDNGGIKSKEEENILKDGLKLVESILKKYRMKIVLNLIYNQRS